MRDLPKYLKLFRTVLGRKVTEPLELTFYRKDGTPFLADVRVSRLKVGGKTILQATSRDITEHKRMEQDLKERVKELQCLYGIARIAERADISLDELYQEVVNLLPASWQYPEITCARIIIDNKEFKTRNYGETEWKQSSDIKVYGVKVGTVEVNYLEERPEIDEGPFLKEERLLIDAVVKQLRRITERKRAEEELRSLSERESKSAREWQELFDASTDIISLISPDFEILRINKAGYESTGKKREEIIRKKCYEVIHGLSSPIDGCPCQDVIRTKKAGVGEITQGGRHYIATASPILDKNNELKAFTHTVKDITERKRAEEELQESERKYRSLVNNVKLGIFRSMPGPAGMFSEVNPAMEEITGYSKEELLQMNVCDLYVHPEEREAALEEITSAIGKVTKELNFRKKDGTKITVSDTKATMRDSKGKILHFDGILENITERKQMEQKLRETQEQLIRSERLAAIGQLAGGVGHELRNPLGAIKNAVYYIRGKVSKSELGEKEPRVMEFLNIMDDEVNASNKIISDLLGFSRVGKPSVSPTRIQKVIEDALLRITIPENIELPKKLDADLLEVEIDADQIQQVLVNIITNAVQAMPDGGKLTIGAREKDEFLEMEIADTGDGIADEAMDKIFDPLFTTKAKGIGLGLAVCQTIIGRHQGNIEVKSHMGKGTTFTIKLPLKAE